MPVNQPPTFALNASLLVGEATFEVLEDAHCGPRAGFAVEMAPGVAFEDHQTLSFLVEMLGGEAMLFTAPVAVTRTGALVICPVKDANGAAEFRLTLLDDDGVTHGGRNASDSIVFSIAVLPVNDVPFFSSLSEVGWKMEKALPRS